MPERADLVRMTKQGQQTYRKMEQAFLSGGRVSDGQQLNPQVASQPRAVMLLEDVEPWQKSKAVFLKRNDQFPYVYSVEYSGYEIESQSNTLALHQVEFTLSITGRGTTSPISLYSTPEQIRNALLASGLLNEEFLATGFTTTINEKEYRTNRAYIAFTQPLEVTIDSDVPAIGMRTLLSKIELFPTAFSADIGMLLPIPDPTPIRTGAIAIVQRCQSLSWSIIAAEFRQHLVRNFVYAPDEIEENQI